jgi:parallel beta-helix repeat protein
LGLAADREAARAGHIACGASFGPGAGLITMDGDVGPCAATGITIIGPGTTLDMDGYTVSCDVAGIRSILLTGTGAVVRNGDVTGCAFAGVHLGGTGRHRVENVYAHGNAAGFRTEAGSDGNRLIRNAANGNTSGFLLISSRNVLRFNTAHGNGDDGFRSFSTTTGNRFVRNTAAANVVDGFHSEGGSNDVYANNRSVNNTDNGFNGAGASHRWRLNHAAGNDIGFLVDGTLHVVVGNDAVDNVLEGFNIAGSSTAGHRVIENRAVENGDEGFQIGSGSTVIRRNRAYDNATEGFDVFTSGTMNTLTGNVALRNPGGDMEDDSAACDANTWTSNVFKTSNAAGAASPACIQ